MDSFADRLNYLFNTVYPHGRGPYKLTEVVEGITSTGVKISQPYLSQLRSGQRPRPSYEVVAAIARFFGVRADFFTDDRYASQVGADLDWLKSLRDASVREIAARSYDLSEGSKRIVADLINHLREIEGIETTDDAAEKTAG